MEHGLYWRKIWPPLRRAIHLLIYPFCTHANATDSTDVADAYFLAFITQVMETHCGIGFAGPWHLFGGVFYGIYLGMPAGLAALLVGLQPLLTATCAGPLLGERLTKQQWLGLLLGLIGISLVLGSKLELGGTLSSGFGAGH